MPPPPSQRSFTLIELLIVVAVIAVLATVVIIVLNPAELLRQSRDSNRISDMRTMSSAVNLYGTDQSGASSFSLGSSSVLYISVPDASSTCGDLGMPALPSGWTYHCASSSTYRNANGTGWLPVAFSAISSGNPLGTLPVDPVNQTSTGEYYAYSTDGTRYELTALPESQKQRTIFQDTPQVSDYPGVIAMGTSIALSPLYNTSGLNGYWKFDEGTGTVAMDSSGNGNTGTLSTSTIVWIPGKIGDGLYFDGTTYQYVDVGNGSTLNFDSNQPFSIVAWVDIPTGTNSYYKVLTKRLDGGSFQGLDFIIDTGNDNLFFYLSDPIVGSSQGLQTYSPYSAPITLGTWQQVAVTYDGSSRAAGVDFYINGAYVGPNVVSSDNLSGSILNSSDMVIGWDLSGSVSSFDGSIDDERIYSRILSPAEILALYNAER